MDKHVADKFQEMAKVWNDILDAFFIKAELRSKQILVLGCSTSEVIGHRIGQGSSIEVAELLLPPLLERVHGLGLFLAVQGCEHINRALVVEEACLDHYGLEEVTVLPALHAGGAMTVKAWETFTSPVMVEQIQGHAGIDIGDTFIGMHLRPVAIPIRIHVKDLGEAHLTLARTRPRLIGGPRAAYAE
ncbi:TIGR01440 family protein [Desulfosporosinus sp.]|uniref:TIGR01440 family protein n=1 Tax=Desulfosporosinus sp. TaxID=157907 RepID=UPI000E9FCBA5|nr:TIGR01440 family protein [Desulfosporosinus sp.]MBC2721598.1 TIGR01440 family protein [Desulfosporosinus sp.]MBC2727966.1 TIGR01440 family protein [Desulfosporosinus sp.]HBV86712.1 TIGR01440 family protein [Desulfosporosinus sp.]